METTTTISSIVSTDMLMGIVDEFTGVFPIVLPVSITMLGIRKAVGFLLGALARA